MLWDISFLATNQGCYKRLKNKRSYCTCFNIRLVIVKSLRKVLQYTGLFSDARTCGNTSYEFESTAQCGAQDTGALKKCSINV